MFSNDCKQQIGIDPKLKVAIGNTSEIYRSDKLCIYAESMEQFKQYIEVLEKIKDERPDFAFKKPILTTGTIDNWIGIGSDIGDNTSYNKDICDILVNSCNKYFSNMSRAEIIKQLTSNPELLGKVRNEINEKCYQSGRSPEKICIREEDVQSLKKAEFTHKKLKDSEQIITETKSIEEITKDEISPNELSEDLMQQLRESGYDGKSGHPLLQSYYQLFCRNQDEGQERTIYDSKVDTLENKLDRQNDEIYALKLRSKMFENTIRQQTDKIENMRGVMRTVTRQINNLQETVKPRGTLEKIKGIFAKKQNLLPAYEPMEIYEPLESNVNRIYKECSSAEDFVKQNTPQSVEEIVIEKEKQREKAKALEKERENGRLLFPSYIYR